jgi:hypothetical protein
MAVALPFIGAAVGWGIGGTFLGVSAVSWGWFAGSLLASAVGGQHHRGPRLNDLNVVGTDYGGCIPWAAGSPRLAPQYAWASPMREIANTQKVGKGGGNKQTTYTYECDVGVILTENVTEGVARDWVNSELIRNGLTTKDGVWEAVTVYTGEADQLPDPTYEAIYGAGNVSAFRGCTTIVIRGLQLGQGKQLPNLEHQPSQPRFGRGDLLFYAPFDDDFNDHSSNELAADVQNSVSPAFTYTLGTGVFNSGLGYEGNPADSIATYVSYTASTFAIGTSKFTVGFWVRINGNPTGNFIFWSRRTDGDLTQALSVQAQAGGILRMQYSNAGAVDGSFTIGVWHYVAMSRGADGFVKFYVDGAFVGQLNTPSAMGNSNTLILLGNTTADRHADANIDDVFILQGEDLYPAAFDPPPAPAGQIQRDPYLYEVIDGLMERAGYASTQYEVSTDLDQTVFGYATSSVTSTRAHLETLRPFGLYEANCSDKLYIRPRAATPVGTVEWSDLGAVEGAGDASDPFPLRLGNETEMPAQIAVRYRNVAADWNVGTEFSDRLNSSQTSTQVVEMAFGMTPAQAKALADTMLKDVMAGLGRATLRVGGRKYARYEPGDVLETTSPQGRTYRFRILVKKDTIVMQEWDVVLDDASVLDTPGITYEGYISTENPVRVAPTDWEVMAIRPLRDADASDPGPYVAVAPSKTSESDEWPGSVFVRARLPEAFEQVFVSGDVCTMGTCLTTLGDYSGGSGVVQRGNKLRVRVNRELSSASYYDFFTVRTINAAVVGNEPVRFIRADFVGMDGLFYIYDLSGFLRGQLGMESEIPLHGSGERFVLLDSPLRRMVNETADIDQAQQVKGVTLNLLLDSVTDEEFTDDGIALRPLSPVYLREEYDGGDISLSWIRRSRLVSRWTDSGVISPLGELVESYRVKVFDDPDAAPVRTVVVTSPEWTYGAADIASDGFATGDPITFTVHQLSDMVGEGDAAILETEAP